MYYYLTTMQYVMRVSLNVVDIKGTDAYDLNDDFISDGSNGDNAWMMDDIDEDYVPSMNLSDVESSNNDNGKQDNQQLIDCAREEQDTTQPLMISDNIQTTEHDNVPISLDVNAQCPIIAVIADGLINKCLEEHKFDVSSEDESLSNDEMNKLRTALLLAAGIIKQKLGDGIHNPVMQITLPLTVDNHVVEWEIKYDALQLEY